MQDFQNIYDKSVKKVYGFLLRLCRNADLAEELTEETFYQAFLHIDRFDGRCEIDTWLCQIAKNAFAKEMKRRGRFADMEEFSEMPSHDTSSMYYLENREYALQMFELVHELEEPYREVFMLKVFGELTFKEIASVCKKSESWAKMTYYRAKARVVERWENGHGKK